MLAGVLRLRLPRAGRPYATLRRAGAIAVFASVAVTGTVIALHHSAPPAQAAVNGSTPSASSTPATGAAALNLTLAATQSIVAPATAVSLSLDLANTGSTPTGSGTVQVALTRNPLSSAGAVSQWNDQGSTVALGSVVASGVTTPVTGTGLVSTMLTVPASAFPSEGVWGVLATWQTSGGSVSARTVVTVTQAPVQAQVAAMYALTPGPSGTGLLSSDQLSELTSPVGALTRQLNALVGKNVSVGLDPRILASIRALGSGAPSSATGWLAELQNSGLDIFALQYADADPALQSQIGLDRLLSPGGFADLSSLNPSDLASLLSFNYSRSLIWPAASTVTTNDLKTFQASGSTQLVLSSHNVASASSPVASVGNSTAFVAQQEASAALARALAATTSTSWMAGINELQAQLALAAGQPVLLAPDRALIANAAQAAATFDLLANSSVSVLNSLSALTARTPVPTSIVDQPESAERIATAKHVLGRTGEVSTFSAVATTPAAVTDPQQRLVLAIFDTGWLGDSEGWASAVAEYDTKVTSTLTAVRVVRSSTINVLSSEASLPITVENNLAVPIQVIVLVTPSNGRLVVGEQVVTAVAAQSRVTARVPVKARIGNGSVMLAVRLEANNGTVVDRPAPIPANVQADWEGWGAAGLATLAGLLFTFGLWRQIRRRRLAAVPNAPGTSTTPKPQTAEPQGPADE